MKNTHGGSGFRIWRGVLGVVIGRQQPAQVGHQKIVGAKVEEYVGNLNHFKRKFSEFPEIKKISATLVNNFHARAFY